MTALPRLALIAGPTASGKSALALHIAERHRGTIINADASQVYADLRTLSARPSVQEEARAPHRLFGHVDGADGGYSAPRWAAEAKAAIADAIADDRLPILVGGSGLYLRTLIDGIAPVPEIDPAIRAGVRALATADAYTQLQARDPATAARLRPTDTTRICRALEVVRSTGRSLVEWQTAVTGGIGDAHRVVGTILLPDRTWLRARCDLRLAMMFDEGAVEEVRALLARTDIPPDAPVLRAIGVREITDWLAGRTDRATALDLAQAATRQYAKRQSTWFRNQPPPEWPRLAATDSESLILNFETRLLH